MISGETANTATSTAMSNHIVGLTFVVRKYFPAAVIRQRRADESCRRRSRDIGGYRT
jgi:hypothetical protein